MRKHRLSVLILCSPCIAIVSAVARAQGPAVASNSPTAILTTAPQTVQQSHLEKAEQLYRTGKLDAAAQEYNALLQAEPKSALAYAGLVHVYLKQKKPVEAYAAAGKAIEAAPMLAAAHVALGEAYFRQGKILEADKEFATLVKANTREPRAYLGLYRVYTAASFFKHAKLMIDRAHELDPADPDIRRAWIQTLGLRELVKYLQEYLAGETNDDPEERQNLEHRLVILQDQLDQPNHSCRLVTKLKAMETNLETLRTNPTHIRGYGLQVKLNGAPSKLLLDTGAGGILVNRKTAEKAGIKRLVQQDIRGVGDKGPAGGYIGYADSIKIGDLEFQNCPVDVLEKTSGFDEDGLIGADLFSQFLVDIDLPNQKFRLSELPPRPEEPAAGAALGRQPSVGREFHDRYIAPEMRSFTPVFRFGHALLIDTKLNDLVPKLFLIDTGAFDNTISPEAAREVTRLSSSDARIRGLSGTVNKVFVADALTIQFSHLKLKKEMFAFDTAHFSNSIGTEVSGMLGFSMLQMLRIKIDYRDGLVDFEYDSKRFH